MENLKMRGLKEEDSEIELELGLGVGGSFKRGEETMEEPIITKDIPIYSPKLKRKIHEENLSFSDPESKRRIHALRRQEAKKKLEEKQKKKKGKTGVRCHNGNDSDFEEGDYTKNIIIEDSGSGNYEELQNVSLDANIQSNTNLNNVRSNPNAVAGPAMTHFRRFPIALVNRSYQPYQVSQESVITMVNRRDSEKRKTASSNGSPIRSSSIVTDLPNSSSSLQGGKGNDCGTHSTHSCNMMTKFDYSAISHQFESTLKQKKTNSRSESDSGNSTITKASSLRMTEIKGEMGKLTKCEMSKSSEASHLQSEMGKPPKSPIKSEMGKPPKSPIKSEIGKPPKSPIKSEIGKPPSPPTKGEMSKPPTKNENTPSLVPQKPLVTTTGSGPQGKKIYGFLLCNTSELSIVCVCHGSYFSPQEFVHHAGGVDVTHPLRHIKVVFEYPYAV